MSARLRGLFLCLALWSWDSGVRAQEAEPVQEEAPLVEVPAAEAPAVAEPTEELVGLFRLHYAPPSGEASKEVFWSLNESRRLERLVRALGATILLPRPLFIEVGEGDAPAYDRDLGEILLPYGYLRDVDAWRRESGMGVALREERDEVLDEAEWVVLHLVGHALLDLLELRERGGDEEELANAVATLLALRMENMGYASMLGRAVSFAAQHGQEDVPPRQAFYTPHRQDKPHLEQVLCWLFGSDPASFRQLLWDGGLPPERSDRCMEDFELLSARWTMALEPHWR